MTPPLKQTQTQKGKAFEYAIAVAFARTLNVPLDYASAASAKSHYDVCDERLSMDRAAREAALFLAAYDKQLEHALRVEMQAGTAGQRGDARDVLIRVRGSYVGISAKTHHYAIKHPRLSSRIDFGKQWTGFPVSTKYWNAIQPVFAQLKDLQLSGKLFKDIPNKEGTIYLPILTAFEDEFLRLSHSYGGQFTSHAFRYLIGTHDFYKVVREDGEVLVQSFNMNGTLGWGRRWSIPVRVERIQRKAGSMDTLEVTFEGGWLISFRLHNARSRVESSLKFDVNILAAPTYATGIRIPITIH